MASQRQNAGERDTGRPGAGGRVELVADLDRPGAWMLLVDGISQSHVDLDDPRHLELEYMRRLGHLTDLAAPADAPLRVLHLGAGALTLARYVAATRPGSSQLAVESDPEVAALVRRRLPVDPSGGARPGAGRIVIRMGDARAVLERLPAGSSDVVVADVFAGDRTPAHLTSVEFTRAAAGVLAPTGVLAGLVCMSKIRPIVAAAIAPIRSVGRPIPSKRLRTISTRVSVPIAAACGTRTGRGSRNHSDRTSRAAMTSMTRRR